MLLQIAARSLEFLTRLRKRKTGYGVFGVLPLLSARVPSVCSIVFVEVAPAYVLEQFKAKKHAFDVTLLCFVAEQGYPCLLPTLL